MQFIAIKTTSVNPGDIGQQFHPRISANWETSVLAEERQNQILSLVNLNRSISITEIQRRLAVSRETIRRDLLTLAEQRKIRKTHGGAISLDTQEPEMAIRQTTNVAGKRAIGRLAAGMIPDGASVILGSTNR